MIRPRSRYLRPLWRLAHAIVVALILAPAVAYSFDLFVSPSGSDTSPNAGGINTPFQHIQSAIDAAAQRAGALAVPEAITIYLRQGVYTGGVQLYHSGSAGNPLTLRNYPGEKVTIELGSGEEISLEVKGNRPSPIGWITIQGLEIARGHNGIKLYNAHDVTIRGNYIHHHFNQGILGNGVRILIERNEISHTGLVAGVDPNATLFHGLYLTGTSYTIINNLIHDNLGYGLQLAGYPFDPDKHASPEYSGASDWLISNNTFAFQKNRAGIAVWQPDAQGNTIKNNIFYQNTEREPNGGTNGIVFSNAGPGNVVTRNLIFLSGQKQDVAYSPGSALATVTETDTQDPLFSGGATPFLLSSGSPAIDHGLDTPSITQDYVGNVRPSGAHIDIGAYEYSSSTVRPAPPSNLSVER